MVTIDPSPGPDVIVTMLPVLPGGANEKFLHVDWFEASLMQTRIVCAVVIACANEIVVDELPVQAPGVAPSSEQVVTYGAAPPDLDHVQVTLVELFVVQLPEIDKNPTCVTWTLADPLPALLVQVTVIVLAPALSTVLVPLT